MATPDSLPHVSPTEMYAALEEWVRKSAKFKHWILFLMLLLLWKLENCLELLGEGRLDSTTVELSTITEGNIIADCLQQL